MKKLVDNGIFYHSKLRSSIEEEVQFIMTWAGNQNSRTGNMEISDFLPSMLDHVEKIIGIASRLLRPR